MLRDKVRQRQHVVVDEDDALAARARDAGVAGRASPPLGCATTVKRTGRARARRLDHRRRCVGRAVVDEHDLVGVIADGLIETRFEHALEQRGAIVGAELNRRAHHATSDRRPRGKIRGTSRLAMQA